MHGETGAPPCCCIMHGACRLSNVAAQPGAMVLLQQRCMQLGFLLDLHLVYLMVHPLLEHLVLCRWSSSHMEFSGGTLGGSLCK